MKANKNFDLTLLISRLTLAIVVGAHGVQKLFGWFGGYGFDGTMSFFTQTIGLPSLFALLIIAAETFGMIALMSGFLTRVISGAAIVIMIGAIVTVHAPFGFYMNWGGNLGGEGYEFHILAIASALVTLINGAGAYSIDSFLLTRMRAKKAITAEA